LEKTVERVFEEVEVSDYGKRRWTWWQVFVFSSLE